MRKHTFAALAVLIIMSTANQATAQPRRVGSPTSSLTESQATHFAGLALKCVAKEYPNKPEHVMNNERDVQSPKDLHPAFYGCYDWHSSVHGHWMLVRILRMFPDLPLRETIHKALDANLTKEHIEKETAYLKQPNRQSFERTYGWAWFLKLAEELALSQKDSARVWSRNLQPLTDALIERYLNFLPKQTYPIRTGVHPNTAFGLAFAFDYAKTVGNTRLANLIAERSRTYFGGDKNYPASWEPGGEDFFSPALMDADLMRRVMDPAEFRRWFRGFLPQLTAGMPRSLLRPAIVSDRSDPKLVHLDGLNLSRAWCMRSIAWELPLHTPARRVADRLGPCSCC
jgi:hypothetical protein